MRRHHRREPPLALLALALLALGPARGARGQELAAPRPALGDVAPVLQVDDLDGVPVAAAFDQRPGHVTVVDFFATWCGPCQRAHADLAALRATFGDALTIIFVDVGEEPALVRRFVTRTPPPTGATVVLDRTASNDQRWGADRLPSTFLVDATGVIRHINRGWGAGYQARLGRWVRQMLPAAARR